MISVIIPTIWKCTRFTLPLIEKLTTSPDVGEIIIINNNPVDTPSGIETNDKIRIVDQQANLYFNSSMNLGVTLAENNICCLCNDDILVKSIELFSYINTHMNVNTGGIFISPDNIIAEDGKRFPPRTTPEKPYLKPYIKTINHGPGMLMFVNKNHYVPIPDIIVHWWGDVFLHNIFKHFKKDTFLIEGFNIRIAGTEGAASGRPKSIIDQDTKMLGSPGKMMEFILNNYK